MHMLKNVMTGLVVLLLATGVAVAAPRGIPGANPYAYGQIKKLSAPEIDAASGTSAIALLTCAVFLMKERVRSRRSSEAEA